MPTKRKDILAKLVIFLATVTGVKTVVRTYGELDITKYASADLPLIEVREPRESNENELTARRSIALLDATVKLWFVDWNDNPQATYETLITNIRNKIGSEFKVTETAIACWVIEVGEIGGQLPVWNCDIRLMLQYYLNQLST